MTLEEFKNLKVGESIKFDGGDVWELLKKNTLHNWEKFVYDFISENENRTISLSISWYVNSSGNVCVYQDGVNFVCHFSTLNITKHIQKSEKELIQEQIKTLQDKLIEIEKNDVENVIKNLVSGQFIEVYYKDSTDKKPYIYMFLEMDGKDIDVCSYEILERWTIQTNKISKIIVRNDITEAYNKFISFVKSTD